MFNQDGFLEGQYDYALDLNMLDLDGVTEIYMDPNSMSRIQVATEFHYALKRSLIELERHQDNLYAEVLAERGAELDQAFTKLLKNSTHSLMELDAICYSVRAIVALQTVASSQEAGYEIRQIPIAVLDGSVSLERGLSLARSSLEVIQANCKDKASAKALVNLEVLELSLILHAD